MRILTEAEAAERLSRLQEWQFKEAKIEKTFRFGDFAEAMEFVTDVADLAEETDHHPDISIHYNEVTLTLWSHAVGGLTRRDFDLAEKIDGLGR